MRTGVTNWLMDILEIPGLPDQHFCDEDRIYSYINSVHQSVSKELEGNPRIQYLLSDPEYMERYFLFTSDLAKQYVVDYHVRHGWQSAGEPFVRTLKTVVREAKYLLWALHNWGEHSREQRQAVAQRFEGIFHVVKESIMKRFLNKEADQIQKII